MFRIRHQACLCVLAAGVFAVGAGKAEQFWIAYEGDDYPENQGWTRVYGNENGPYAGGANRSLSDGIFTLDSLHDSQIYDFYETDRSADPGPGEMFVAEWRVLVDPSSTSYDVGVVIARALSPGHAAIWLGGDGVYVEPGDTTIGVEAGAFHSYRFESADMSSYTLTIDGAITFAGHFEDFSVLQSFVNFGDGVQGERSLSRWDYFRYGIVPEPASVWGGVCLLMRPVCRRVLRRTARRPGSSW